MDDSLEQAVEQAVAYADSTFGMLADGAVPPRSLARLKEAIRDVDQSADPLPLRAAIFDVLIDQTLDYEVEGDKLVPSSLLDYSVTTDDRVVEKMRYLYTYGLNMLRAGMIAEDALTQLVTEKLCARVGLDGPAFDAWLEVPAVK